MKRVKQPLALLLALLLALSCGAVCAAALTAGDVNLDDTVTADDARLALRASVKIETLTNEQALCADADRDGDITAADARLILRAAVRLETLEPVSAEVTRTTLTGAELDPYKSADYEILQLDAVTDGTGRHILLDDYETVTFDLPANLTEEEAQYYAGVYFDENNEPFFLLPDPDALAEGKVSFETIHYSMFGAIKMTEEKQTSLWCERAGAQDVTRRISEADITPTLKEMVADAMGSYGLGKDQYAGAIVRYILSHDTRGEILTAAADGDMEALRSKLISGAGEYFLGKFLKGEDDDVITQSFGDHEAAIRKSLKDKDYATATLEIVKNIEKNMFPAVSYAEKFAGLVDKLADIWTDDMMNEQYAVYERMMHEHGYVSDDDWGIIYTQLRGAANRLSSKGVNERALRNKFEERFARGEDIAKRTEELKERVQGWKEDGLLKDTYWTRTNSAAKRPGVTDKLSSLRQIREMLRADILTVDGTFRKGKSYEISTDDEFLDDALFKWVTLGPNRRAEFFQWLRDEGVITAPPVTYPPEYAWVLVETRVDVYENTNTGIYKDTYTASEAAHTHAIAYIGDEEKTQHATFTATCTAPPAVIRNGDEVVMTLGMSITDNNDKDYHFGESSSVRRDRPDMGLGTAYSGFARFQASVAGEPDGCNMSAIGDWGKPPTRISDATVCHTFGGPGAEEALHTAEDTYRIAIYFWGCGAQTVWVYEWQNIAD